MFKLFFIVALFIIALPFCYKVIKKLYQYFELEFSEKSFEEKEEELKIKSENFKECIEEAKKKNKEDAERLRRFKFKK